MGRAAKQNVGKRGAGKVLLDLPIAANQNDAIRIRHNFTEPLPVTQEEIALLRAFLMAELAALFD